MFTLKNPRVTYSKSDKDIYQGSESKARSRRKPGYYSQISNYGYHVDQKNAEAILRAEDEDGKLVEILRGREAKDLILKFSGKKQIREEQAEDFNRAIRDGSISLIKNDNGTITIVRNTETED